MKSHTPLSALLTALPVILAIFVSGCKKEQVKSDQGPQQDEYFSVEVTELTQGSLGVSVVPQDMETSYYFGLIEETVYTTTYEGPQALVDANLQNFRQIALDNGISLEQLLAEALLSGEQTWLYEALTPSTRYLFYAYHISSEGQDLSPVTFVEVVTPAVKMLDTGFTITAEDQTHTSFSLRIVPDDSQVYYYYDAFTLGQLNDYCGGDPANIKDFLPEYFQLLKSDSYADYTVPQFVNAITVRGEFKDDYSFANLLPETDYYAFAVALGNDMQICSPVSVQTVSTAQSPVNQYGVDDEEITDISYSAYVSASEPEAYAVMLELKEYFSDDMTDAEVISALYNASNNDISGYVHSGMTSVEFDRLIPSQDYCLFVFACNSDGTPKLDSGINLTKHEFRTLDAEPVSTRFLLSAHNPTQNTVRLYVDSEPRGNGDTYMFNYITKADYDAIAEPKEDGLQAHMNAFWQDQLNAWKDSNPVYADDMTMKEFMSRYLLDEASLVTYYEITGLEPGTDYVAYLFGMKPDGTFTTDVFTTEFTTVEEEACLASMSFVAMAINYSSSQSTTYYLWVYPEGDKYCFYGKTFIGTDEWEGKSREELVTLLGAESPQKWSRSYDMSVPWSETWYFYGVVYDNNGTASSVYRIAHTVPAEGEGASVPTKQEEVDIVIEEI